MNSPPSNFDNPSTPSLARQMAEYCLEIRDQEDFLRSYSAGGFEAGPDLLRFEFNKEILVMFLSSAVVAARYPYADRSMEFSKEVVHAYLGLLSLPRTSLISDYIICIDELRNLAFRIGPDTSAYQLQNIEVLTVDLFYYTYCFRVLEFLADYIQGVEESSVVTSGRWLHVARRLLMRVRNLPADEIPFDHVNRLAVALVMLEADLAFLSRHLF